MTILSGATLAILPDPADLFDAVLNGAVETLGCTYFGVMLVVLALATCRGRSAGPVAKPPPAGVDAPAGVRP